MIPVIVYGEIEREDRLRDDPDPERGDIEIQDGALLVHPRGITAKLSGPLARLSGCYPWDAVPVGIAVLRVLLEPFESEEYASSETFEEVVSRMEDAGFTESDLDAALGKNADNVHRILQSSEQLVMRCPRASTACDIARVVQMSPEELDLYLAPYLR